MFDAEIRRDEPIITSLSDLDFYKLTMGQVIFNLYRHVQVKFVFHNRTKSILLANEIDLGELREHLDACRSLQVGNSELHYLRGTNEYGARMFGEPYLDFWRQFRLPAYDLRDNGDGTFSLEFPGDWSEASPWETLALSIVDELYFRTMLRKMSRLERDAIFAKGVSRLHTKIKLLKQYPEIMFSDFGTRRRFLKVWQRYVLEILREEMPGQLLGTSNVMFANELNLLPMGTSAHEMYMGMYGIMFDTDEGVIASHNQTLTDWWDQYGYGLSIALTDTYGTDAFFRMMTEDMARNWKGLRHDSGNPFEFAEKAIKFYESFGIDPRTKLIVFSDGLDEQMIINLWLAFHKRIKVSFGWGTNLTNDMGLLTLSLVVKLLESCGHPTVKLPDNLAKAMGPPEQIARAAKLFQHTGTFTQACRY